MKHIFYVHSGITYLVSLAVIDHLKLELNAVVIIICRSIKIDEKFCCIKLEPNEENIALLPSYGSPDVLRNLSVLRKLDTKMRAVSRDKGFTLYLPSEKNYLMQFLQSHPLCFRRNFIEEGLLTYRAGFVKSRPPMTKLVDNFKHFLRFLFHLNRTSGIPNPEARKDFTIYVVTKTAQHILRDYKVVLLNASSVQIDQQIALAPFTALYIFDAVVEMSLCANDNFMECLENFVAKHVPRQGLAIKFHPFQKEHDQYLAIFNKYNIQYTLLGSEVIPEVLLAQQKNLSIYGLSSSVLFYAKEMGHCVRSFSSELAKKDLVYKNYVTQLIPNSIIEYLKLI